GAGAVREDARLRLAAVPLCRGDRREVRPPPGELPAGLHPPGADQRGDARDPRRPGADEPDAPAADRDPRRRHAARDHAVTEPLITRVADAEAAAERAAEVLAT